MKKIYTGIDIGSDSIKIVVSEYLDGKFNCLASTSVRSVGIKSGLIVDEVMACESIKLAVDEIEKMIGVRVTEAIVAMPTNDIEIKIESGEINFDYPKVINGVDVVNVLKDSIVGHIENNRELVTVFPISFTIDDEETVKDPKGMNATNLSTKAVITTVPKKNMLEILKVLKGCNITAVDVTFGAIGDYYQAKNDEIDSKVGAIINIGGDTTNISIYNKGIMIKNKILEVGSRYIDNDISYVYKIDRKSSRRIKETFAVSSKRYADINDTIDISTKTGEKITINQHEISNVVEYRLIEILKLAKNAINDLTNREISYIIITGGITELVGFQYVVDNIFDTYSYVLNIPTLGVRSNKYSTSLGIIKYFYDKLEFREKENYTMFDEKKCNELISA